MPIPARFYFYWSGNGFSFLNHLAAHSLLRKTPGAACEIHFDQEPPPSNRHWTLLRATRGVTLRKVDFPGLLRDCGMDGTEWTQLSNGMIEAHKSDLFRYLVLFAQGGVYADFDVIFVRDFTGLLRDEFFVGFQSSTLLRRLVNAAVLGASAKSPVLRMALGEAMRLLRTRGKRDWGDFGPDLMTKVLAKDCLRNKALRRCAKLAHKLHCGRTVANEMLFRFLRKNHNVTIHHRDCFYYRSWRSGDWERIFDDSFVPSNAYAIHLWHKASAVVMDAIDETNYRDTIKNPVLLALCDDLLAKHS